MSLLQKLRCLACGHGFTFNPDDVCDSCKKADSQFCYQCHNYNHRFMPLANCYKGNRQNNYLRFSFMYLLLGVTSMLTYCVGAG